LDQSRGSLELYIQFTLKIKTVTRASRDIQLFAAAAHNTIADALFSHLGFAAAAIFPNFSSTQLQSTLKHL
jgi:hypothetical protein